MTDSLTSSSDQPAANASEAFARLHPRLQRWVYRQGWTSLRDAQERAIDPILTGSDLVITAATAAGKTEAAFLPICSVLATEADRATAACEQADPWLAHDPWNPPVSKQAAGVQVLYVSPLKALINDQFRRLEEICDHADIAVHRWHGDVAASAKAKLRRTPSGVLLITPESLEAMFVTRGSEAPAVFAGLRYVVIDELHTFLGEPRGAQLQSLMHRVELAIRRRVPRIGLSATLGDLGAATWFLRPTGPEGVQIIASEADRQEVRLQIRGYQEPTRDRTPDQVSQTPTSIERITDHLFATLRGQDNLVFANQRSLVEEYALRLADTAEAHRLPNEFWPHHGSLAKQVREDLEQALKDPTRPTTAVCTSTLEMGIDIGSIASVAQIGPPPSAASMRQRLGRSGRRGEPAVLRIYITEPEITAESEPVDQLHTDLVKAIAMTTLMRERWLESPTDPGINLSTLIQQVLSLIAQHGGATARDAHRALCSPGPFWRTDAERFGQLLRAMGSHDLISQAGDGTLVLGCVGERHVNHHSFYAAFESSEEWRLVANGQPLGTLPVDRPLVVDHLLVFSGRRWRIVGVDERARVVDLAPAPGGTPPAFGGGGPATSTRVRSRMEEIYRAVDTPAYLDPHAAVLLDEARTEFHQLGLHETPLLTRGNDTHLFVWVGDRVLDTLAIALRAAGISAVADGPALLLPGASLAEAHLALWRLAATGRPDPEQLARLVENRQVDKWDWVLDDDLSAWAYAARMIDSQGAWEVLEDLLALLPQPAKAPERIDLDALAVRLTGDAPYSGPTRAAVQGDGSRYCVIDVETTGFSPRVGDRVVEICAVSMTGDGEVLDVWATLLNPQRDVGATAVHGITDAEVKDAPSFATIAGDLLALMDGCVVVAHNLRFDWEFLSFEFQQAGLRLPPYPRLCTIALGRALEPWRATHNLHACCADHGVLLDDAHEANADAVATAKLLGIYLQIAERQGGRNLRDLGVRPQVWPARTPDIVPSGQRLGRKHARTRGPDRSIEVPGSLILSNPAASEFVLTLERACAAGQRGQHELRSLAAEAQNLGLSESVTRRLIDRFLTAS